MVTEDMLAVSDNHRFAVDVAAVVVIVDVARVALCIVPAMLGFADWQNVVFVPLGAWVEGMVAENIQDRAWIMSGPEEAEEVTSNCSLAGPMVDGCFAVLGSETGLLGYWILVD